MAEPALQVAPQGAETSPEKFGDPALEEEFELDRQMLQTRAPSSNGGLILLGTLALFIVSQLGSDQTAVGIAALVGVLLVHELGHLAGMKLFGYRDVKMFFIPFFGAAVSGKRRGVAGWKEAVVLLLGPLPGIALGLYLAMRLATRPSPAVHSVAMTLVLVNAFNLLPVSPLDGGRFFHLLLFCRHRVLEILFASFAAIALIASVAIGFWILPIMGVFMLFGLPRQWRLRRAAETLQQQFGDLAGEPSQIPEARLRAAFLAARTVRAGAARSTPRDGANAIEQVLERAATRPPSILASVLLFVPWLAALAASFVAVVLLAFSSPPKWETVQVPEGRFSVLMPRKLPPLLIVRETPFGPITMTSLDALGSTGPFTARWYDLPAGKKPEGESAIAAFLDGSRDKLLERANGTLVSESAIDGGRALRIREPDGREALARIQIVGQRVYLLFAPSEPADEATRFFDSFKLVPGEGR